MSYELENGTDKKDVAYLKISHYYGPIIPIAFNNTIQMRRGALKHFVIR